MGVTEILTRSDLANYEIHGTIKKEKGEVSS